MCYRRSPPDPFQVFEMHCRGYFREKKNEKILEEEMTTEKKRAEHRGVTVFFFWRR